MFPILAGLSALVGGPASGLAANLIGELFGNDQEQQQAPTTIIQQAPTVAPPPPPPPPDPMASLATTGYFNGAFPQRYADGGLVEFTPFSQAPNSLYHLAMQASPATITGPAGVQMPAIRSRVPGWEHLAEGLNKWLSGDLSFLNGYADGGPVEPSVAPPGREQWTQPSDEEIIQQAMGAIAGYGEDPDSVIAEFVARFGDQALADLASQARSMGDLSQGMPRLAQRSFYSDGMQTSADPMVAPDRIYGGRDNRFEDIGDLFGGDVTMGTDKISNPDNYLPGTAMTNMVSKDVRKNWGNLPTPGVWSPQPDQEMLRKDDSFYIPPIPDDKSNGRSDSVPALLSEGEFVVPADVVSGLGLGSTDAGVRKLQKMIENVRQFRAAQPATKGKK